ncbi:MAG: hypothetical protein D6690_02715 [Nitrospirae bacterium]|nr:MAG: hypothetical protein D6690_02715 [Nitrospirota bacterium]
MHGLIFSVSQSGDGDVGKLCDEAWHRPSDIQEIARLWLSTTCLKKSFPSSLQMNTIAQSRRALLFNANMPWQRLQAEISGCRECMTRWPEHVSDPLAMGEIPDPPPSIEILFVGVAPTNLLGRHRGTHFYSSPSDPLRRGLFRLLQEHFHVPLSLVSMEDDNRTFHAHGYFFVHAGKARPLGLDAPPRDALSYCARRHVSSEIPALKPKAICFLGKTRLSSIAEALFDQPIAMEPVLASLGDWSGWVALAPQPVRGNASRTLQVLSLLRLRCRETTLERNHGLAP